MKAAVSPPQALGSLPRYTQASDIACTFAWSVGPLLIRADRCVTMKASLATPGTLVDINVVDRYHKVWPALFQWGPTPPVREAFEGNGIA
jgi:hypothetical protein